MDEKHWTKQDLQGKQDLEVGIYNKQDYGSFRFFGPTIYIGQMDPVIIEQIKDVGNKARQDPKRYDMRKQLAGNLSEEYNLKLLVQDNDDPIYQEIKKHCARYICGAEHGMAEYQSDHYIKNIEMESMWINYQKQYEWQPEHSHSGHLSFVLYCQIPNSLREEEQHPTQQGNSPMSGAITLSYGEDNTYNTTVKHIMPETGDIIVFPNWLRHYVYPFVSDVERIAVAGNVFTDKTFAGDTKWKDSPYTDKDLKKLNEVN
tara:strand:+ start:438 stop:1214 length:777 start_codon:yes stop_codon:yes gene_type:complete